MQGVIGLERLITNSRRLRRISPFARLSCLHTCAGLLWSLPYGVWVNLCCISILIFQTYFRRPTRFNISKKNVLTQLKSILKCLKRKIRISYF